jgi:hypothetical protein
MRPANLSDNGPCVLVRTDWRLQSTLQDGESAGGAVRKILQGQGDQIQSFAAGLELHEFPGLSAGEEQGHDVECRDARSRCRDELGRSGLCSVIPFIFVLRSLCDYLNSYMKRGGAADFGRYPFRALHAHTESIAVTGVSIDTR